MAPVTLLNFHLVDVIRGEVHGDATLRVEDERIAGIGGDALAGGELDLGGMYLVPGLIDVHSHLSFPATVDLPQVVNRELPALLAIRAVAAARATLNAGVTTVRDGASTSYIDIAVRDAVDRGYIPGPRVSASGYAIRMTGGHGDPPTSTLVHVDQPGRVDGADEVRKAARLNFKMGADHLKVFASGGLAGGHTHPGAAQLTQEEMAAAVDVARSAGGTVMAHSYSPESCRRAILAGVDSLEHACLIDDAGLALAKEHGTFVVPTLTPFWRGVQKVSQGPADERAIRSAGVYEAAVEMVRRAYAAGVSIAMGTDTGTVNCPHGENLREIALLAEAGMSGIDALRTATIQAARLMKRSADVGSIEVGKYADLVGVNDNPLEHPEMFGDPAVVRFVMKGGSVVRDDR